MNKFIKSKAKRDKEKEGDKESERTNNFIYGPVSSHV